MSVTESRIPTTAKYTPPLQSERVFRILVEGVRDYAIFLLDPVGNVASWNPGAERIKGYTAQEIIGTNFSNFYPQVDRDAGKPEYELKVAAETGRFEDEGWRIRKDGSRFWASVVITRVCDENGKLIGYGKITRDLTERRIAEQRYRLLVEGVSDYAIYSLDVNGNVTSWNAGAQRIKGYNDFEILGKHFSSFYTPEDAAAGMPAKVLQTAADTGHFEGEGWRMRKDGTRFWSSVVVTPIRNDEGILIGFSKITRDVTDRKKLLDQIQKHAEELELRIAEREQTNAELEAFSYSVSHDLRAPLRAIEGFTQAFIEDYGKDVPEQGLEYLSEVTAASKRMNRLVQDLLNFSRLGRIHFEMQPVRVAEMAQEAIKQLSEGREFVHVRDLDHLRAVAHPQTLVQAVSNLVSNALKFVSPEKTPEVVVSAERIGECVRISVKDNGIGIASEHQEKIFQVFERLHGQEQFPGTGIGLAIVKRGIQRMGGRVGLQSKPGEGSTFWVELPEAAENV
ncbi:MAG TPA: PAS domain S-box protein [Terracidiphilus sp.]|jgi:PAS domain S-box-containing protein